MFRFYSTSQQGKPRITVVATYDTTEKRLNIAVAKCSAKDQFIKAKGRMIAEGRLAKGKTYESLFMETCNGKDFHIEAERIALKLINTKK